MLVLLQVEALLFYPAALKAMLLLALAKMLLLTLAKMPALTSVGAALVTIYASPALSQ
jgi:hypothetical protein